MAANNDELEAPAWMDIRFFEQVLQVSQNNRLIKVADLAITPGSGVGEHFSSIMFRAKVTYKVRSDVTKTESFIVKTMPYRGAKADAPFLKDDRIFVRESQVYTNVLVEMQRLLKQAGDDTELGPRLVYSSKHPAWVLVFEDLAVRGYAPKTVLLNLEETRAVLLKLAKWHATSFFIGKSDPASPMLNYESLLFDKPIPELNNLFADAMLYLKRAVEKWPGDNDILLEKLQGIYSTWYEKGQAAYKGFGDFAVLCHGDFHCKNVMYKHIDDKFEDLLLIDYQVSTWSSPAIDLIYALYTMANKDTRLNHRDELITYYHTNFVDTLTKIGYMSPAPTMHNLQMELLRCGVLEFFVSACFLPFFQFDLSNPPPEVDLTKMFDPAYGMDFRTMMFGLAEYTDDMQKLLPRFMHLGFLD